MILPMLVLEAKGRGGVEKNVLEELLLDFGGVLEDQGELLLERFVDGGDQALLDLGSLSQNEFILNSLRELLFRFQNPLFPSVQLSN